MSVAALPFLSLSDPATSAEGALDPLGLAPVGDRLANRILPGFTARMHRPRFLTAIAVAAVVCDGLEDVTARDGVTPAYIVFEWLLVEGFARHDSERVAGTPGINKARAAVSAREPMSARQYLKTPSVFGYHGVYKRLARHVGVVDDDLQLREAGYELVRTWEREQGLDGFAGSPDAGGSGASARQTLRAAVESGLAAGHTDRSFNWLGWRFFADRLAPGAVGPNEAALLRRLLDADDMTAEIVSLVEKPEILARDIQTPEARLVEELRPSTSPELAERLAAIAAYERACGLVEEGFDWLRYLSTRNGARPLSRGEYGAVQAVQHIVDELPDALRAAESALRGAPPEIDLEFAELARAFEQVGRPEDLYDAVLERHATTQRRKPPEGKREWFERASDGAAVVRIPYRLDERPERRDEWARPYRLRAVRYFCRDLRSAAI